MLAKSISGHHWNHLFKQLALAAKLPSPEKLSSHSQRRGSTTEAANRGATFSTLKRHGRWRSNATVAEYIEESNQFKDSAASLLVDFK